MERITLSKKSLILTLILQFIAVVGFAQSQTFTSSGTFNVPAGVTTVTVEAWGGGGKGGDRSSGSSGSGGGGGGAYVKKLVSVPGSNYTVTVGNGSTSTSAGGDSYFINNSTVLAKGGSSVSSNNTSGANGGSANSSIGDVKVAGGSGANAASNRGGGGGAGAVDNGADFDGSGASGGATNGTPGSGGAGAGGNGRTGSSGAGSAGTSPGGGGGGAYRTSGGSVAGGNGAAGRVIIYWGSEIDIQGNGNSITDGDNTPSTTDFTDFGNVTVGLVATKTFTIYNTGYSTLTIGAITFSGTNSADFTVTSAPASSIIPGASTTFVVTCNASGTGTRNAAISIVNNDGNENPYNFSLTANALPVEIDVQGNATSIVSGDTTPSASDWTDFGTTDVTSGTIQRTFTIHNTGAGTLSVGSVTVSGTNAADFTVTAQPSTSVLTGAFTTFVVTFNPSAAGTRVATINIPNNDINENPYTFAVEGDGIVPEINVQGNATNIVDGDTTPSASDWTIFATADVASGATGRTFTIFNTGSATLNIGTITFSGTNPGDFSVSSAPPATIAPGGSATFTVLFDPTAAGVRTAVLNIPNDDPDENPYNFTISGSATTPEMNVQGNSTNIADGDTTPSASDFTNFGSTDVASGTIVRTFTIQNLSSASGGLSLGAITISGTNAADFTVTAFPASSVAINSSTTFQVTFNPSANGTRTATISILNNDIDESPYTFAINGTGLDPEINVQGNGNSIADGDTTPVLTDWTDFGSVDLTSGTQTRTFTIQNTASGNTNLTLGSITISGANAGDFAVTTAPGSSSIAVNGSTTFVVTFNPSATGVRNATINIPNNDSDESPYTYAITGTGIDPEIDVRGNSVSIVSGDTTPSTTDSTDFGSTYISGGTVSVVYTIYNSGTTPVTISTPAISGTNAGDFTITASPSLSIAAGGNTSFTITFNPSATGVRNASISIANNDYNENPYTFSIRGTGTDPEINVVGNGNSISSGDTTPSSTDFTSFGLTALSGGTISRVFTIQNQASGTSPLIINSVTITGTNAADFSVTVAPASPIAVNGSTTFTVVFDPSAVGTRNATINISNNDSNESPYTFAIQGTCSTPEINIQGNSNNIADGTTSTSSANYTDFGSSDINTGSVVRTYTIQNSGSVNLTISSVTITGTNASDFTVTTPPATTVAASGSTTFQVTFNPSALLSRNATVNVFSDDLDEATYDFAVSGYGFIDTDGDGIENTADRDDDNDGILDSIECDSCSLDPFVNGSFESPVIGNATYSILPTGSVTGWQTSAENYIEIWSSGFNGVTSASGNQFAELNANVPGLLYQTFCLSGNGGTISWSVKHRARQGTDQAFVKFGPSLAGLTTIATMVDDTSGWGTYSGTYNIPVGQTQILLAFEAGYTGSGDGSVGNFIDDIQIIIQQPCRDTDGDGIPNSLDLDSDNDGIPDIEEAGFKAYSSNFSKVWPITDTNSNGFLDALDAKVTAGTYSIPDSDGDGVPDYLDLDSDNDAQFDVDESTLTNGDGDINGDGFGDGPDSDGDGILDLYDNNSTFGTAFRAYAPDTDGDGIPNYLEVDANTDGVKDILTTLYGSYDANLDGRIDGSVDADKDGILDTFDTNPAVYGSPRDLNRKLFLDFDGRNDYGEATQMLGGLTKSTIMGWIKLSSPFTATGVVIGQDNFNLKVDTSSGNKLVATANGVTLTYNTALSVNRWYHIAAVYDASNATEKFKLYVNGRQEISSNNFALNGSLAASSTKFTFGKTPGALTQYFKGSIDEVRIFNTALTTDQLQKMVYQEIDKNGTAIRGTVIPKDIESTTWANLIGYYRMDAYKDDVIDNYATSGIDAGSSASYARIYNNKVITYQLAPMPFVTTQSGALDAAVSQNNYVYGPDVYTYDWSILQMKHNINLAVNMGNCGLFVDPSVTFNLTGDNALKNFWYLKLDGKLDLQGKAQLVQTASSDLAVTSAGYIERDQQGTVNKWNYNYWSSPVGTMNTTTNNNSYTVAGVFKDGTNPANPQNITWTSGLNSAATSPITLSSYWIFKFQNVTDAYANWATVGQNGTLLAGQGFTLKGSSAATPTQNYVFVGKPNSGVITSPIAANNLNLSGNPYASALDANAFISDNLDALTGTIYFWEHFSTNNTHTLVDYQGGYATYTLVGGTPPVAPSGISGLGSSSRIAGRFIPVGQGFFVVANSTGGQIKFSNAQRAFMRETDTGSNVLFRHSANASPEEGNNNPDYFEPDTHAKVRIGYNSANSYHRQVLLGFMDDKATAGIDPGYDAIHFDDQPNDMYFMLDSNKLNIEGDGYFNINNIYPLGVKNAQTGTVSFTLDGTENFDANIPVYIYDNVTDTYHDIRTQKFEINDLPVGNIDNRFSLRFTGGPALGNGEVTLENGIFVAYANAGNVISIKNNVTDTTVKSVALFNMLGQSISTWDVEVQDQHNIVIPVKSLASGTYIVKMTTTKGDISKKIIIK